MEKEYVKQRNPFAFPATDTLANEQRFEPIQQGMTLRDYFASKAMASMINNPASGHWDCGSGSDIKHIIEWAYKYADAMLKQREL